MGNLLLLSLPLLALSGDPWVDETITVDKAAELAILSELRDDAINMYRQEVQNMQLGVGGGVAESQCDLRCLPWLLGVLGAREIFRRHTAPRMEPRLQPRIGLTQRNGFFRLGARNGLLQSVVEARKRHGQARLVLLRYQSIAAQRNVTLQPVTKEMVQELIQAILETAPE